MDHHLEGMGSLSYAELPNVNTPHYPIAKSTLLMLTPISSEKSFKYWDMTYTNFQIF